MEKEGFFRVLSHSLASLSLVATSAKTVHRTVFFRKPFGFLLPCSNLLFLNRKIKKPPTRGGFHFGGERGIRTLEPLLTVTRFPIVRARPTTRFLHWLLGYYTNTFPKNQVLFLISAIFFSKFHFFALSTVKTSFFSCIFLLFM